MLLVFRKVLEVMPFLKSLQNMRPVPQFLRTGCDLACWLTPLEDVCRGLMHWRGLHVSRSSSLTKPAH